jgi:hypothetical protein
LGHTALNCPCPSHVRFTPDSGRIDDTRRRQKPAGFVAEVGFDLTVLAKNNNGVFPYDMVYQVIDGRNTSIASHGTREMPVWGYRFGPSEAYRFKQRILAVIDYLKTMQEK